MLCGICDKPIRECTCDDINDRLKKACESPYVAMKWCMVCDKHYELCDCKVPAFYMLTGTAKENE